jgi:hypothetical protein
MAFKASGSAMEFTFEQNPAGPNFFNFFVFFGRLKQMAGTKDGPELLQFGVGRSVSNLL